MRYYRIFFAFVGLAAILSRFVSSLTSLSALVIFFSYFTMLSNIMACIMFFYLGFTKKPGKNIDAIRGAIVLYMCITGLVVYFILSKYPLTIPIWVNAIVHQIMPVVVFIDWLIVPLRKKLSYKLSLYWLSFPIIFALYTSTHGLFVGWYPYPFFNPLFGGYHQVILNIASILFGSWVLALILIFIGNSRLKLND